MIYSLMLVTRNFIRQALKSLGSYVVYFLLPPAGFALMVIMLRISNQPHAELQGLKFLLFFTFLQAGLVSSMVLKDREEGIDVRIRTAPIGRMIYTLGNALAAFCILLFQTLITLGLIALIMPEIKLELLPLLLGVFLVCSLSAVTLGILLTLLSRDSIQGSMIHNVVIYVTSIMGGCFFPQRFMSPLMQKIAWFFPQSWGVQAIDAVYMGQRGILIPRLFLLLLFAFFFMVLQVFLRQQLVSKQEI